MESPLTSDEVEAQERDPLTGVLGQDRIDRLIAAIWDLESLQSVRGLPTVKLNDPAPSRPPGRFDSLLRRW